VKPFGELVPFEEAIQIVDEHIEPITRTEKIAIENAAGRVLAADLVASQDTPPFDRAAMDGYAVKAADTAGAGKEKPVLLKMVGELHAGSEPSVPVGTGECIRIATGAVLPEGADAVVMVENTAADNNTIKIFAEVAVSTDTARKGSDIRRGETLLKSGLYLDPSKIGVLASQGIAEVTVYQKPKVAIMPSGEEVVPPGGELKNGQLYDINSYTMTSVVRENGGIPFRPGIIGDNREDIRAKLDEALKNDIVVVAGGSSVGDKDLMSEVIAERGTIYFHGLKIKPGKPTMLAIVDGKPVFGMPGYPTSCLVNSYLFVLPALRKIAGLPPKKSEKVQASLTEKTRGDKVRVQFMTVKVEGDKATPVFTVSGAITSIARANGYIVIQPGQEIEKGETVTVTYF
jgi:molybdenum cofactor synthesis domain-containing protein